MDIIEPLVKIIFIVFVNLTVVAYLVLVERRVSAFIQNRIGPNRVGPGGMFQPVADIVKLFLKEDIVPKAANKFVHSLAPIISLVVAMTTFAVIPFGNTIHLFGREITLMIADVNVGILYLLALSSLGVYGITLSGWSSNNKYSLLGGLRSSAQMISYELSMGLAIIGVLMIAGTLQLNKIVESQAHGMWYFWRSPVSFITFVIASFAETNRLPFDLPEAEPELVGGYHTEYSGMKFGLFFLAEYANMITASAVITTLYPGRMAAAVRGVFRVLRPGRQPAAGGGVRGEGRTCAAVLHSRAVDHSAFPVRPADEHRLESDAPALAREHLNHGIVFCLKDELNSKEQRGWNRAKSFGKRI